jgi:hypothetical protein
MAKVRYAIIANDTTETSTSTANTITKDLPETGILNMLDLQVTYTKEYSNDRSLPDWEAVTKVEVLVDGSTVVKSLTGKQIRALTFFNGGPFTGAAWYWATGGSTDSYCMLPLYFGKDANDTTCGLDLAQYSNPQVKITYDVTQTSCDGLTFDAATTPAFKYNIGAKIFDGKPAGFTNRYVQSLQLDRYTVAASTEHPVQIPRGYDLKGLMIGARYLNVGWNALVDHLKLDFDNGSWVPLDIDHENLMSLNKHWFPNPVISAHWIRSASADTADLGVGQVHGIGNSATGATVAQISYDMHETGLHDVVKYDYAGAAVSAADCTWETIIGSLPMGNFYIPMSKLVDGAVDSIRTTDYGRIDLKITTGSGSGSSAKNKVVAEYLKPNGQ